jgi:hypothetical protein
LGSIKAGNSLISVTLLSVYQKKKKWPMELEPFEAEDRLNVI